MRRYEYHAGIPDAMTAGNQSAIAVRTHARIRELPLYRRVCGYGRQPNLPLCQRGAWALVENYSNDVAPERA